MLPRTYSPTEWLTYLSGLPVGRGREVLPVGSAALGARFGSVGSPAKLLQELVGVRLGGQLSGKLRDGTLVSQGDSPSGHRQFRAAEGCSAIGRCRPARLRGPSCGLRFRLAGELARAFAASSGDSFINAARNSRGSGPSLLSGSSGSLMGSTVRQRGLLRLLDIPGRLPGSRGLARVGWWPGAHGFSCVTRLVRGAQRNRTPHGQGPDPGRESQMRS